MKTFEHVNAVSAQSAVKLLAPDGYSRPIAGGTDLLGQLKLGIVRLERLVNLKSISGLGEISFDEANGLRIGALATLDEIAARDVVRERYPVLFKAISVAASPQLRNFGTIAGNLLQGSRCWYYRGAFRCWLKGGEKCYARDGENAHHAIFSGGPCYTVQPSDPAPALVALGAQATIVGPSGKRVVPVERLFQRPHEGGRTLHAIGPSEVITEVAVPPPAAGSRGTYLKAMERRVWAFALASCAANLTFEGDEVLEARLVLGGVAAVPWRAEAAEAVLRGNRFDVETVDKAAGLAAAGAQPLAHNSYKVPLVKAVVAQALKELASRGTLRVQ